MRALFPPGTGGAHTFSVNATMLMTDPPDHTRLRRLVVKAFTSRAVERLRPDIERITDELLDSVERAAADGTVYLVESFAMPIPVRVIGDLLAVPAALRLSFRSAVEPLLTSIDPDEVAAASAALVTLLRRLIHDKRQDPGRDLLTALIEARDNGDQLSDDELLRTAYLLILAGYETTVNLIGNAILALLQNPSQLAALRDQPSMLPAAVEEFLRYESPINIATIRFTTVPIRVGDVDIPANEFVMIALLAANRDDVAIRRFRPVGHCAKTQCALGIRPRNPLLRRRSACPDGSRDRPGADAGPVPSHHAGRPGDGAVPHQHSDTCLEISAGPTVPDVRFRNIVDGVAAMGGRPQSAHSKPAASLRHMTCRRVGWTTGGCRRRIPTEQRPQADRSR